MPHVRFPLPLLEALCAEYQTILRLKDWRVTVRIVRRSEIEPRTDRKPNEGEVRWNFNRRTAEVLILSPRDFDVLGYGKDAVQDMEITLAHELTHLKFAALDVKDGSPDETVIEHAVEDLSEAIVLARRGKRARRKMAA